MNFSYITDKGSRCEKKALVIFDGSLNIILYIGISRATNLPSLYQDHKYMHNALKAFVQCSNDVLLEDRTEPVALVGVLATMNLDKEKLELMRFCSEKNRLCCNMFLSKDDMKDEMELKKWYEEVSEVFF